MPDAPLTWSWVAWRGMHLHCNRVAPREACGALLGRWDTRYVQEVRALTNVESGDSHYRIDEDELLSLFAEVDGYEPGGMEVLGWFHSHPRTSSQPSELDLQMAVPGFVYAIVGLDGVKTFIT